MKLKLITGFFLIVGFSAYSQTSELKASEKTQTTQQTTEESSLKPKDAYLGKEKQIAAIMIDGVIPESFPRYEEGMLVEDYKLSVKVWIQNNKELIKEEEYQKLEPKL